MHPAPAKAHDAPTSRHDICALVNAHPGRLTAAAAARILAGVERDEVPADCDHSRWWGAARPKTKGALVAEIHALVAEGQLTRGLGGRLLP